LSTPAHLVLHREIYDFTQMPHGICNAKLGVRARPAPAAASAGHAPLTATLSHASLALVFICPLYYNEHVLA
jgi:hypothetical protein